MHYRVLKLRLNIGLRCLWSNIDLIEYLTEFGFIEIYPEYGVEEIIVIEELFNRTGAENNVRNI